MILLRNENLIWSLPYFRRLNERFLKSLVEDLAGVDNIYPVQYLHGGIKCSWNKTKDYEYQDLNKFIFPEVAEQHRICPVFDFSDYAISDEDLNDEVSNIILDIIMSKHGAFEVSSDKLYSYIKRRYPHAMLIAPVEKSEKEMEEGKEVDFYNRLLDKYDKVVLSPKYVKEKFLQDAEKINDPSRLEVIVNERRVFNCAGAEEHNLLVTKSPKNRFLPDFQNINFRELYNNSLALSTDDIDNIYQNSYVRNFRIVGNNISTQDFLYLFLNYVLNRFGVTSFFTFLIGALGIDD